MFSTILAVMICGGVSDCQECHCHKNTGRVIMADRYGFIRVYNRSHLTVDKTARNQAILRKLRDAHNDKMIRKYYPNPRIWTHGGNGYTYGIDRRDPKFKRYFDKYAD